MGGLLPAPRSPQKHPPVHNCLIRNQSRTNFIIPITRDQKSGHFAHLCTQKAVDAGAANALIRRGFWGYNATVNKSARRAVLYAFFGLFLILGAGTVLYAQGYRFDPKTMRVKKVGAIYVQSHPKDAVIFLDGKKVEESRGILSSGVLLQNLFPKNYNLELKLDGYEDWQRTVQVEPSLVTESSPILLPLDRSAVSERKPQGIYAFPGGTLVIKSGGKIYSGASVLPGTDVIDHSWKNRELLTRDAAGNYYFVALSLGTKISAQKLPAKSRYILDYDPEKPVSYSQSQISIFDLGGTAKKIFSAGGGQRIEAVASGDGLLAWSVFSPANATSSVWIYEKFFDRSFRADISLSGRTTGMKFSPGNLLGVMQDNGDLYVYDPAEGVAEKKGEGVKGFAFSPEDDSVAILGKKTLEVFSDENYTRLNLTAYPEIESVSWYRETGHLILGFRDGLGLLDLSAVEPENIQRLTNSTITAYEPDSNTLYYAENGVWKMEIPK